MDKLNDSYTIVLVRCYLGDNDPTESGLEELDTVNGFYFSISCKEGKNFFKITLVVVEWNEKRSSYLL